MLQTCQGVGKYGSSTRHEQVAYSGDVCPVCEVIDERNRLSEELLEANKVIQTQDTRLMEYEQVGRVA